MPDGSWKCEKCNNINYPFRTKCNRQNCGADKPLETKESQPEAADANDQVCCVVCLFCLTLFVEPLFLLNLCKRVTKQSEFICNLMIIFWPIMLFLWSVCLSFYLSPSSHVLIELSTVPVSTRHVWEGPESSSIAQCGCLKVSHVVPLLLPLLSYWAFLQFVSSCINSLGILWSYKFASCVFQIAIVSIYTWLLLSRFLYFGISHLSSMITYDSVYVRLSLMCFLHLKSHCSSDMSAKSYYFQVKHLSCLGKSLWVCRFKVSCFQLVLRSNIRCLGNESLVLVASFIKVYYYVNFY